jgi:hypothetical protein
MLPKKFKIGGLCGFRKVRKEKPGALVIRPIAVCELVSDLKAVQNHSKRHSISGLQASVFVDRSHQGVGSFESASCRAYAVQSAEQGIPQSCRLASV